MYIIKNVMIWHVNCWFQEECQNYVRVIAKTNAEDYLICGTNSFKPLCRTYRRNVSSRNDQMAHAASSFTFTLHDHRSLLCHPLHFWPFLTWSWSFGLIHEYLIFWFFEIFYYSQYSVTLSLWSAIIALFKLKSFQNFNFSYLFIAQD